MVSPVCPATRLTSSDSREATNRSSTPATSGLKTITPLGLRAFQRWNPHCWCSLIHFRLGCTHISFVSAVTIFRFQQSFVLVPWIYLIFSNVCHIPKFAEVNKTNSELKTPCMDFLIMLRTFFSLDLAVSNSQLWHETQGVCWIWSSMLKYTCWLKAHQGAGSNPTDHGKPNNAQISPRL